MFGGDITFNNNPLFQDDANPNNYFLINFNDTLSSFISLFITMFVVDGLKINYPNLIFMLFFVLGTIVIINIIVAHVIDMYDSIENLFKEKKQNKQSEQDDLSFGSLSKENDLKRADDNASQPINNSAMNRNQQQIKIGNFDSSREEGE
mmetsp:Transcript_6332/g.7080  ORF Transcript_6332/g.7080 Transcript_6332/m.7080 type:complete len:149 (+) Transcript_6332:174-620(+)